ncbi:MAG: AgmX/PglI C-terminal domain-containing protein [Pseudomonadota bacterium]
MKSLLLSVLVALTYVSGSQAAANADPPADSARANETVFDRNKGAIYALYARALRDRPGLAGKIVFEIDIDAAGAPAACRVKSSQLHAPEFENQLCERIRLFRFAPQAPNTFTKELTLVSAA